MKIVRVLFAFLVAFGAVLGFAQSAAKIKSGDVIGVTVVGFKEYTGEYSVLNDGSISGAGFGRATVVGKTITEAQTLIVSLFKRKLVDPSVSVFFRYQRPEIVYLINSGRSVQSAATGDPSLPTGTTPSNAVGGAVILTPGMNLRKLLSGIQLGDDPDVLEISLSRANKPVHQSLLNEVLASGSESGAIELQADDVVTILPRAYIRVWVTGEVNKPGQVRMFAGTDLSRAIAQSGGVRIQGAEGNPPGSLSNIWVMRGSEGFSVDLSKTARGETSPPFILRDGDLVYVRQNDRAVSALGQVRMPGRFYLEDGKTYRATDVLALAQGLAEKGTLRRVFLARSGVDGKITIQQFNLDEYLKDGKLAANPEVRPDDVLLFGMPQGVTLANIGDVLSPLFLLNSIIKR